MVMLGALLLLLAGHAVLAQGPGAPGAPGPPPPPAPAPVDVDISGCPIFYYGKEYEWLSVQIHQDSSVDICFTDEAGGTSQDCILWQAPTGVGTVETRTDSADYLFNPLNFASRSRCKVVLDFKSGSDNLIEIELHQVFHRTALQLSARNAFSATHINMIAEVGGSEVESWSYTKAEALNIVYKDLSGCRDSGLVALPGTDAFVNDPDSCRIANCNSIAETEVTACGVLEFCEGNHTCTPSPLVCTVTGSSVIDFFGRVHIVPDQCVYFLIMGTSMPVALFVGFREQRRKDVPLIDHVVIYQTTASITLHQDGSVEVSDGTSPELSDTPQVILGVELFKDETGITARLPLLYNMTVFFDGNTARFSGFIEGAVGMCGTTADPTVFAPVNAFKLPSLFSAAGCEIQQSDDPDSTIDCTIATERCTLLNETAFTACHDRIDPEGFITACVNLTCQYPMVDGLNCQFFEAYAETCLLKDIPLEWRAQTNCPVREAFCPHYCSDHEFCGESLGEKYCLCRATFASDYKATDSLGISTVCAESSATLTLIGCLLAGKGIDYSALHLIDPDCKGHMDEETHMVAFSFNSSNTCGTEVLTNDTQLIYKNTVMLQNASTEVITRTRQFHLDFSCYYALSEESSPVQSVSFRIQDSSVVKEIVSGVWNYTLMMNAYTDSSLVNLVDPDAEIQLGEQVWVQLKTEGLDENLVAIVTDSCWATSQSSPDSSPRYDLVTDGCPNSADTTVSVLGNGLGTSNAVTFRMFEFTGEANEVYLHCMVELCPTLGQSCAPSCGGSRKRRAFRTKYAEGDAALITMGWNN